MTTVNHETGEIVASYGEVKRSIEMARESGAKFFEQIVWQIENAAWSILGYADWDEMREAEYGDMGVTVPRADRPEIVSRMRRAGMTQAQIAETVGVSIRTVESETAKLRVENPAVPPVTVTNARGQQRPASYAKPPQGREPPSTNDAVAASDVEEVEKAGVPSPTPGPASERHLIAAPPTEDEYTEQDRAEELAASLAKHLSALYALAYPERRIEFLDCWHRGVKDRPVLGQSFVTPTHMRTLAAALQDFATEWETANV